MPYASRLIRAQELAAAVALTTSYANGDYTVSDPAPGVLLAIHFTGAIAAGAILTFEVWDSTLDRQYVPATTVTMVAANSASTATGQAFIDVAIPRVSSLKIKAKLSAGTGSLDVATLMWEA